MRTVSLLLFAVLLLSACGGAQSNTGPSGTSDRVSLLVFGEPEELAAYRQLGHRLRGHERRRAGSADRGQRSR